MMNELKFDVAFIKLMQLEGGFVDDPDDPGGATKYGISERHNPGVDIANLTIDDAKKIYKSKYWDRPRIYLIANSDLCKMVFLFAVNAGTKRAVRILQSAANIFGASLDVDGVIGPKTAGWINGFRHQLSIIAAFKTFCNLYYIDLNKPRYIAGWLKRLET